MEVGPKTKQTQHMILASVPNKLVQKQNMGLKLAQPTDTQSETNLLGNKNLGPKLARPTDMKSERFDNCPVFSSNEIAKN